MKRLLVLLLAFAAPALAHADDMAPGGNMPGGMDSDFLHKPQPSYESTQRFAIEIKFTPYTPHIDDSKGLRPGTHPFADLFLPQKANASGGNANGNKEPGYKLLTSVEFDWQILRRAYGNFGIGLTTGFYRRTTHSFIYNVDPKTSALTPCAVPNCVRSGDETGLNIMPLSALLIYKLDVLANRYHFPLVPYVKAGLGYYIWWVNDGNGILSAATYPRPDGPTKPTGVKSGYGGSFGIVLNPGIALQLDFIDRSAARTMDHELGINHTYLFCELSYAWVNGFNATNKLNLSDTMLNAGIGFEF